jgi:hypothetical protein
MCFARNFTPSAGPHHLFLVDAASPLLPKLGAAAAKAAAASAERSDCADELYWVVY